MVSSAIAIAALTLLPEPGTNMNSFWCLKCGERAAVDVLLNIILFIPLGVGLGLYGYSFRRAAAIALACTCFVEFAQFVIPGRDPSARDILMNFFGGVIGFQFGRDWRAVIFPRPRVARMLAVGATIAWLVAQLVSSWALQIAPPPEPWYSQKMPERDNYPAFFKDTIVSLALDSMHIQYNDELPEDSVEKFRQHMLGGTPFRVSITDVDTTRPLAAVAIISGGPAQDVVWWAVDKRDAVYGTTVRGTFLRLRTPTVRIRNVIPESRNDTVELTGMYRNGRYELQARDQHRYRHLELRASPSWAWSFVLPYPLYAFGSEVFFLTALYLVGVWFALGYWSSLSAVSSREIVPVAGQAVAILLGLAIAPVLFALPIAHWSEWLAAIAGATAGWIIGTMNRDAAQQPSLSRAENK